MPLDKSNLMIENQDPNDQFGFLETSDPELSHEDMKAIISRVQARLAITLATINQLNSKQLAAIDQISAVFITQVTKANEVVKVIKEKDADIKAKTLKLPIAVLRLATDLVASSEIIDVIDSVFSLAHSACDNIDVQIDKVIDNLKKLTSLTCIESYQEAERTLLQATDIDDQRELWARFKGELCTIANEKFTQLYEKYLTNPDFITLLIKQYIQENPGQSITNIEVEVGRKALELANEVLKPLEEKVEDIEKIKMGVLSHQGKEVIRAYFIRLNLINWTLSCEKSGTGVSKHHAHQLAKYFDFIAQKKYLGFLGKVKYKGRKMSASEYKKQYRYSPVKLGLFHSQHKLDRLYDELHGVLPELEEALISGIIASSEDIPLSDTLLPKDNPPTVRKSVYRFSHRTSAATLFSNHERLSPITTDKHAVVLKGVRSLDESSSDQYGFFDEEERSPHHPAPSPITKK